MLDQQWRHATQTAATLADRGLAVLPTAARRNELAGAIADVIAVVLYEWAVIDSAGELPIPMAQLYSRLADPGPELAGVLAVLDNVAPSLRRWKPNRRPPADLLIYTQTTAAAAILHDLGGIRLGDRVLAVLPGTDAPVPARVVRLVDIEEVPGDIPRILVTVESQDRLVAVDAVHLLLDLDQADTSGRGGRGTHAHAVRCVLADLRRTAHAISAGCGLRALHELAARTHLYEAFPDLHQELIVALTGAVLDISPRRSGRRPSISADFLAAIAAGLHATALRDGATTSAFLHAHADRIQARHL